ncbi:gas vesicle protein GvpG [Streptomyces reniochalinae]|uniref:Gas vesicle protein n=1 Tax=Streptomyces reniochalinae TaxID=2250578 RepID=A0A367EST0_9ACTN|nr:gas vesicle protein GvpG [Streptomyces reniochalinae]RCG21043.1 hypothetical protein DQ392_09085 [Streptomyces reniochalinae]
MGLFSGVLLLPLAPVRGVEWVAGRLLDVAEQELYDPATVRAQLGELNRAYEEGELTDEEFEREEERLLDLLEQRGPSATAGARTVTTPTAHTTSDVTETSPTPRNQA